MSHHVGAQGEKVVLPASCSLPLLKSRFVVPARMVAELSVLIIGGCSFYNSLQIRCIFAVLSSFGGI